jgi:carbonic anhydrase/acetyltransferase-like protein (isoleucine patch superfamily)
MKEPRAGRVRLDPTAFVAPGAVLIGEVTVGRRASVWFNTVVRGDVDAIEIGEASNVQDNSTLHVDAGQPVRIGARVTVGHRAIVHGCVIEDDCLIGMGSVLLSGCRIGAGSYLGASSLVLEGMQIPPGSVALGSPARVTGSTLERHQAGIRHGSETYAALAEACMRRGYARPVDRHGEIVHDRPDMTYQEWGALVRSLGEMRTYVDGYLDILAPEEIGLPGLVDRLLSADRTVRRPCLEALLGGEEARWEESANTRPPRGSWTVASDLEEWRRVRTDLAARLSNLGPMDWRRVARHATRGPFTLAELVREWMEEDLDSLRWLRLPPTSGT